MGLTVYKGFDEGFLKKAQETPLVSLDVVDRLNVLKYDRTYVKKLKIGLLGIEENVDYWILYLGAPIPEYIETAFKKSEAGNCVLVSWPSKNVLICQDETSERQMDAFNARGWSAYRISDINLDDLSHELVKE